MINLYYDPKTGTNYYSILNKPCDSCGEIIVEHIIVRVFWDNLGSDINYLCTKCKRSLKKSDYARYTDTFLAIVTEHIPSKAIPRVFSKPSLSTIRDISVFDAALQNLGGETVMDKTVYAGRSIPKVPEFLITEVETKVLSDKELDSFFASVKNSVPIIKYDEKKLLKQDDEVE